MQRYFVNGSKTDDVINSNNAFFYFLYFPVSSEDIDNQIQTPLLSFCIVCLVDKFHFLTFSRTVQYFS